MKEKKEEKKEDGRFKEGNRHAAKHSKEGWEKEFEKVYANAVKGKYNSLQQAFIKNGIRPSTYKWLASQSPVLAAIKEDIQEAIILEVNTKGLEGDYNPAMCIWRTKQLGEKDTQYQEVNSNVRDVTITDEEKDARIKELMKKAKNKNSIIKSFK